MSVVTRVEEIQAVTLDLKRMFEKKIAVDEHKAKLFDNMHKQLLEYQNGAMEQKMLSLALEVIQVIDAIKKTSRHFAEREGTLEDYQKLLQNYEGLAMDLQDCLYRQGIEPYESSGCAVDVKRQKIVGTVVTEQEEFHNTIAEKTAEGYEKEGKVIRAEKIKIYQCTKKETERKGE